MSRTTDRQARRMALIEAAERQFAERGVANTAVSHIADAAGVAKGTFYLYFESKEDALGAVAERLVDGLLDTAEAVVAEASTPMEELGSFLGVLGSFDTSPDVLDLVEVLHRPENRLLHDRLEERMIPRLVPLMEGIVERGRAGGVFRVTDPRAAAWFILGGLRGAELAGTPASDIPDAMEAALVLSLRALGYVGDPGAGFDRGDGAGEREAEVGRGRGS